MTDTRPQLCVGAVIIDDGRLLMVRRGHGPAAGTWAIPGGRVERGETVAEAVVREVREETGVDAVCGPLIDWVELIDDDEHLFILDFRMELLGPADPVPGSDATEATWVSLDLVTDRRLAPGLAEFLADHRIIEELA